MAVSRREFFTQFGRGWLQDAAPPRPSEPAVQAPVPQSWLRPPGALPEAEFMSACTRCTACQEACPYDSIKRLGPEFGSQSGTPAVIPDETPCYLCTDMPCITACEPAALVPVARHEVTMGLAVLDEPACLVSQQQPCDYCLTRCPLKGEAISADERGLPVIHGDLCTGCGVCAYLCPGGALTINPTVRPQT